MRKMNKKIIYIKIHRKSLESFIINPTLMKNYQIHFAVWLDYNYSIILTFYKSMLVTLRNNAKKELCQRQQL